MTADELEKLRRLNFGIRALSEKIDPDLLLRQIERYDAADAAEVSRRFRAVSTSARSSPTPSRSTTR